MTLITRMTTLPPDHPQRQVLADEVHARPFEPVSAPATAGYVAVLVPEEARAAELAHLGRLAQQYGATPPGPAETLWRVTLSGLRLKWERHGEFSGYLFLQPQPAESDRSGTAPAAWDALPAGWFERIPGQTIVAVRVDIRAASAAVPGVTGIAGRAADPDEIAAHFTGQTVVGSAVANGAGYAYTDFRLRSDGCVRMLLLDAGFNPRQAGRMLQRLLEIEAYRMLALLALPIARRQAPRIAAIENALAHLTDGIARDDGRGEELLHELTRLAAEVESGLAASRFRFGACRAYSDLVGRRIEELRESRIEGLQTIAEFMSRRFSPAVATCMNVENRLHDLSDRVSQASSLLATRVGIAREKQNQQLLASMERRARQQLRLQQTVEGLSVAAILYYVIGLVAYVAKGLEAGGVPVNSSLVVLGAVPVAGAAVLWALRRARQHLHAPDL
jgi:uncharacterized membrane-anchored protein